MNILIVDDSATMRGIVKQAIQDNISGKELTFYSAENGDVALQTIQNHTIDLVLLDWNMPVLDGLAFVKEIRGQKNKIPIIMITSVTDEDKILEAASAGVNSYIEKPVRGAVLWEQIKEFIL